MFKKLAFIAILACLLTACGTKQSEEETIVYGTIDENAEVVEQVRPPKKEQTTEIVGNTYQIGRAHV